MVDGITVGTTMYPGFVTKLPGGTPTTFSKLALTTNQSLAAQRFILAQAINPELTGTFNKGAAVNLVVDGILRRYLGDVSTTDSLTVQQTEVGRIFGWVVMHELGHNLGLDDEYTNVVGGVPPYIPDLYKDAPQPVENFMSKANNTVRTVLERNLLRLALKNPGDIVTYSDAKILLDYTVRILNWRRTMENNGQGGVFGAPRAAAAMFGDSSPASGAPAAGVISITAAAIDPSAAVARWAAVMPHAAPVAVRFIVEDLAGGQLAEARIDAVGPDGLPTAGTIAVDPTAAGVGWYLDPTLLDGGEFAEPLDATASRAGPGSPAAGKYDLQTVLAHEYGHLLGFESGVRGFAARLGTVAGSPVFAGAGFTAWLAAGGDHLDANLYPNDLLNGTLQPGVRRLPSALDARVLDAVRAPVPTASGPLSPAATPTPTPVVTVAPVGAVGATAAEFGVGLPGSLRNGRFTVADPAAPGFAWTARGSVTAGPGGATLAENPETYSGLVQAFTVPAGATAVRFTLAATTLAPNGADDVPDAFEAALLDPATGQSLVATAAGLGGTDAAFNWQTGGRAFFGPAVTVTGAGASGGRLGFGSPVVVTISLAGVAAGRQATLYLDLLGFGAPGSTVRVANVQLLGPGGNHAPAAGADAYLAVRDRPLVVGAAAGLLANDGDEEFDPLTARAAAGPAHGAVTVGTDGGFVYTPEAGYVGADRFTYVVADGSGGEATGEVTVTVRAADALPPAFTAGPDPSAPEDAGPLTIPGWATGIAGGAGGLRFLVTTDNDALFATPPAVDSATGALTYTSAPDAFGSARVTARLVDGVGGTSAAALFTVVVRPVNDAPTFAAGTA